MSFSSFTSTLKLKTHTDSQLTQFTGTDCLLLYPFLFVTVLQKSQKVQLLQVPYAEMIFRPPKTKMANLQKKDYLGKAKVY